MAGVPSHLIELPEPDSLGTDPEHLGVRFELVLVRSQELQPPTRATRPRGSEPKDARQPRDEQIRRQPQRRAHVGAR
jgi:hypothetical protein